MKMKLFQILLILAFFVGIIKMQAQIGLAFNGTSNYVSTNGAPVLNNQSRTVDAWIKTTSTITTQMVICDWGVISPNGSRFTLNMINGKLRIEVGGVGFIGTTNINTGAWFHVTAVYESSITSGPTASLYINGALELAGNFTGYTTLTTTNTVGFRMGVRVDGINYFSGSMDEVKVYNYARTQAQVMADTVEYCSPQPGLVAYYKLNEGIPNVANSTNTVAIDYSGFGNNGVLNTFTLSGNNSNWVTGRVKPFSPTITATPSNTICVGGTVSLSTNAITNYTWSTGNSTSPVIVVSPSTNSNYSIALAGITPSMCASNINIVVQTSTINVSSSSNSVCLGNSVIVTAIGANTYTWNNGIINATSFTPSSTSVYTVSATNSCGTSTAAITISVNPIPIFASSSSTVVCANSSLTLTANGATNYTWTSTLGSNSNSVYVINPNSNTNFTLTGSIGLCVNTTTISVLTNPLPTLSISVSNSIICDGQIVNLNVIGNANSYTWLPTNQAGTAIAVTPSAITQYTLIATNSLNCSGSANQLIIVNPNPTLVTTVSNSVICNGGSSTLSVSGASVYAWSSGNTNSNFSVNPVITTTYIVSGTLTSTGCSATNNAVVQVYSPTLSVAGTSAVCQGKTATVTASGATSYTWSGGTNLLLGSMSVSPISTSIYTVNAASIVPSNTNVICPSSTTFQIIVNPNPTLSIQSSNSKTLCMGESIVLTANGASTYTWNTGVSAASIAVTPSLIPFTSYTVNGNSLAGCTSNTTTIITVRACTGIEENFEESNAIKIYPNPSHDEFFIQANKNSFITIFDSMGKIVLQSQVNQNPIKIKELSTGIYFVKCDGKVVKVVVE